MQEFLEKNAITIIAPNNQTVTPYISFDQLEIDNRLRTSFGGFKVCLLAPLVLLLTLVATYTDSSLYMATSNGRKGCRGHCRNGKVIGPTFYRICTSSHSFSGKTLAFGIPAMTRLIGSESAGITTLVVAPTRELAIQTHETLTELGKPFGIASVAIYGGVPKEPQVKMLAAARSKNGPVTRVVVGTPGRIIDLVNDGACDLSK